MRSTISVITALAAMVGAQVTTSIDIAAIDVPVPTSVFVLPVVFVTAEGAPVQTATTLAINAVASSDPKATAILDSPSDVTAAISSAVARQTAVVKRDTPCVQQPLGLSYNSVPDTAAAFAADSFFSTQSLVAALPYGYVQTFSNLTAANSAENYMGFTILSSYDVATCASKCSAINGCNSVNIYFERDPTLNPGPSCPNPPSTINVKCVFWGGVVTAQSANNFGQVRSNFNALIAGSNGYVSAVYAAKLAAAAAATSSSSAAAASATNAAGNIYTIYYSSDSNQGAYSNAQASNSYTDCTTACDADSQCNAFTYVGGNNGVGSGTCWLKSQLGSPTSAGTNVLSGVRTGKAVVSSSSSSVVLTTSSFSSASSSSASKTLSTASSTSSSSSVASTSASSTSSSSSIVSSTSSSSSSVVSSTSSSSSVVPTTMSSVTKSATTTSASSTSASSSTSSAISTSASSSTSKASTSTTSSIVPASTAFYISPNNNYAQVSSGSNAAVGFSYWSATKFQIDTNGYLIEASGSIGYAASMPQGVKVTQKLLFNPTGTASNNYVTCKIDEVNEYLVCTAGGVAQQAFTCWTDGYSSLYFGPTIPSSCSWVGLYRISA